MSATVFNWGIMKKYKGNFMEIMNYRCTCGICGRVNYKVDMVRSLASPTGWICKRCYSIEQLEEQFSYESSEPEDNCSLER